MGYADGARSTPPLVGSKIKFPRPVCMRSAPMKWSVFSRLAVVATLLFSGNASAQATYHAFIWSANTGMQDLGSLGGSSYVPGINASGQVVGYYVPLLGQLRPFQIG